MDNRLFHNISVIVSIVLLSFWWTFLLVWQTGTITILSQLSYHFDRPSLSTEIVDAARIRAIEYATTPLVQSKDIFFTTQEVSHLHDVYFWYHRIQMFLNFGAIFSWGVLVVAIYKRKIQPSLLYSASLMLNVVILLCALGLLVFNSFFVTFHEVLFPQGNWQFPAESVLIQIFPESFWKMMLAVILVILGCITMIVRMVAATSHPHAE